MAPKIGLAYLTRAYQGRNQDAGSGVGNGEAHRQASAIGARVDLPIGVKVMRVIANKEPAKMI